MRRRPIACLALLLFLILQLLPAELFYRALPAESGSMVQVTGSVGRQVKKENTTQIELLDCQIRSGALETEAQKLLIYLSDPAGYPEGTDLSLSGTFYATEEPVNPGQFNSMLYDQGKGISGRVYAEHAEMKASHPAPVRQFLTDLRTKMSQVYGLVLNENEAGLLRAMVLGEKEGLDEETKELYQKNGISHLLAISGLHISLIGLGFYRLIRRCSGSYVCAAVPTILLLLFYGWMTGASVSVIRAAAMCGLSILADLVGRTYDMLTAIGATALVLMLTGPLCVHQSAFRLSYGAVLGIALLEPLWRFCRPKGGRLYRSLSASLSVLAVTFPILLCSFCEYPLYSTILNLLVIPLMSVLMVCGLCCGLLGIFSLPAARLTALPCHMILWLYEQMGSWCLRLPGAVLKTGSPAQWKLVLYYGVLVLGLCVLYREKRRAKYAGAGRPFRMSRRVPCSCLGAWMMSVLVLCLRLHTGLSVTMLDVGQGDSIFLQSPYGTTVLMDGGSSSVKQVGEYRILPYLSSEGIAVLDYMIISHMDQDHVNGLKELVEDSRKPGGMRIGHAVLPELSAKDDAYLEMETLLEEARIPILYMAAGDMLVSDDFSMTCLWPKSGQQSDDRNEQSLVLLADYGEFRMLMTGDIGPEAERALTTSGSLTDVEILKTAHHGSRYSSSAAFLDQTRPEVSLISCSATNRYGHPGEETLERLRDVGSRVFITRDCGAIQVWTDGHLVRVRKYNPLLKDAAQ